MQYAVFSDIHGNYQALKSILSDIKRRRIKNIIYLGDAVAGGPDSNQCLTELIKNNVIFILGNHELYLFDNKYYDDDISSKEIEHNEYLKAKISKSNMEYLKNCKMNYEININDKKLSFMHFFLSKNDNYPYEHISIYKKDKYARIMDNIDSNYTFYGHYHEGRYDVINGKQYYGIGSSGCTLRNKTYYYLIDSTKDINIEKIELEYNRSAFENRIKHMDYPDKKRLSKNFFGI